MLLRRSVGTASRSVSVARLFASMHTLAVTCLRVSSRPCISAIAQRSRTNLPRSFRRSFAGGLSLSLSPREKAVLKLLQSIRHPTGQEDIVYSGQVRSVSEKDGVVSLVLPLDDAYRSLKKSITELLESSPARPSWLTGVRVVMEAKEKADTAAAGSRTTGKVDGLAQVRHVIAVSSCKGGVGKSSVAVNLAYALQQLQVEELGPDGKVRTRDARVGILDADIYGPSLPTMVSPRDTTLRYDEQRRIVPPVYQGVKTMSYGYANKPAQVTPPTDSSATPSAQEIASSGAFIRGPLASAAVKQLASETAWGSLDYLVVDFPPGTGDIQLTLTQLLRLSGAVVVTTPGRLSFVDVSKGMALFQRTRVPVLAVVENMSYFMCDKCDTKHRLFGEQGAQHMAQLQAQFGQQTVVEIPIWKDMAKASDSGDPFMLSHSAAGAPVRALFADLAASVQRSLGGASAHAPPGPPSMPTASFDAATARVLLTDPALAGSSASPRRMSVSARALRLACRCAGCVDELTGAPKLDPARVPQDVRPLGMQLRGNYALAVHWSDGHASSLYTIDAIRAMATPENADAPRAPAVTYTKS